jgi:hypothetical protein
VTDVLRELVLPRFEGVKKTSDGWKARCPVPSHGNGRGDRQASLSITAGDRQPVVFNCHAGCHRDDIVAALRLTWADLCAPRETPRDGEVITEYHYTGEAGEILFTKVRRFPKNFSIKHPDGRGGWAKGIGDARRVLYRLPQILAATPADVIWVAEGEKDCDRLAAAGEIATCNFDGAGKWKPEYSAVLAGRDVLVIADRDTQGRDHARKVAASLDGAARSCWIVEAAAGKDAADHLAAGHGVTDFTWWSRR